MLKNAYNDERLGQTVILSAKYIFKIVVDRWKMFQERDVLQQAKIPNLFFDS